MRNRFNRITIVIALCLIGVTALVFAVVFTRQAVIDRRINNDYSIIYEDINLSLPVSVNGIEVIKQEISCGYAVIEMLASWQGMDITEAYLLEHNNSEISTATGDGFVNEMNKHFTQFNTTRHKNLTNTDMLNTIYESLEQGMPVPLEFAALYDDGSTETWTFHYALITAIDVANNSITAINPYGYEEIFTIEAFLAATRYESYENMEFYIRLGFAAGIFSKNTIYIISEI